MVRLDGITLARMRVTSKGQVTIPQHIRRELGIVAGTEVDFVVDEHGVRLVRSHSETGAEIVARMRGSHKGGMSTDEIMAITRGDD